MPQPRHFRSRTGGPPSQKQASTTAQKPQLATGCEQGQGFLFSQALPAEETLVLSGLPSAVDRMTAA